MLLLSILVICSQFRTHRCNPLVARRAIQEMKSIDSAIGSSLDDKGKVIVNKNRLVSLPVQSTTPFTIALDSLTTLSKRAVTRRIPEALDAYMGNSSTSISLSHEYLAVSVHGIYSLAQQMKQLSVPVDIDGIDLCAVLFAFQMYSFIYGQVALCMFASVGYGNLFAEFGNNFVALPERVAAYLVCLFSNKVSITATDVDISGMSFSNGVYKNEFEFNIPNWFNMNRTEHIIAFKSFVVEFSKQTLGNMDVIIDELFINGFVSSQVLKRCDLKGAAFTKANRIIRSLNDPELLPNPNMWLINIWTPRDLPILKNAMKAGHFLMDKFNIPFDVIPQHPKLAYPSSRGLAFLVQHTVIEYAGSTRMVVHKDYNNSDSIFNARAIQPLFGTFTKADVQSDTLHEEISANCITLGSDLRNDIKDYYGNAFQLLYGINPITILRRTSFEIQYSRSIKLPEIPPSSAIEIDRASVENIFPTAGLQPLATSVVTQPENEAKLKDPNALLNKNLRNVKQTKKSSKVKLEKVDVEIKEKPPAASAEDLDQSKAAAELEAKAQAELQADDNTEE